jgi:glutathione S-transferase
MQDDRPRLIGSGTSPFVRKIRVALMEKGIEHHFDPRSSWNPESPANRLNPLQKVPVLEWPGRAPLFDSRVILQALDHWVPSPPLMPADRDGQLLALQLEALADGASDAVALFTQEGWRAPEARSSYWLERQRTKITAGLTALDAAIAPWLPDVDQPPSLPAIAAGSAHAFARFWQPELVQALDLPRLDALSARLALRAAWTSTAPSLPPGATFPKL